MVSSETSNHAAPFASVSQLAKEKKRSVLELKHLDSRWNSVCFFLLLTPAARLAALLLAQHDDDELLHTALSCKTIGQEVFALAPKAPYGSVWIHRGLDQIHQP